MKYVDTHTHQINTSEEVISIKNHFPQEPISTNSFFSIGIHPWHLDSNTYEAELKIIENHLKNNACIAIGECGMDRAIKSDFQFQKNVFKLQLKLAEKFKKPVIVHCVKAYHDLIEIIRKENITIPIVFHGFSKNQHIHSLCLKIPTIYFSYGKSLLNSKTTQVNLMSTPIERFLLETDDSDVEIQEIYQTASLIKNIPIDSLKKQLFLNFQNIFKAELKEDGEILVGAHRITD
ncbi:MAG: TatD family hydrolase [Flavobacteriaceae bacterium]|nr:TatD family hydrolase [Flavobacteriaceae bacterium]